VLPKLPKVAQIRGGVKIDKILPLFSHSFEIICQKNMTKIHEIDVAINNDALRDSVARRRTKLGGIKIIKRVFWFSSDAIM
jgi:hypothetical protein